MVWRDDIITTRFSPTCRFKAHGSNDHNFASGHTHIHDYQTINQQAPV